MVTRRPDNPRGVCWRCGVPFAWTTAADLARCAQLARDGAA
jgi:hypothetical protein